MRNIKFSDSPVIYKSAEEVLKEEQDHIDTVNKALSVMSGEFDQPYDNLTMHIINTFFTHRDARRESDVEQGIIDDLYQSSGKYRPGEIDNLYGSNIFMNITATKQSVAKSWIKDIIMHAAGPLFTIQASKKEEIPRKVRELIYEGMKEDEERLHQEIEEKFSLMSKQTVGSVPSGVLSTPQEAPQETLQGAPPEAMQGTPEEVQQTEQQEQQKPGGALIASKKLKENLKLKRNVESSILNELHKEAQHGMEKLNNEIYAELVEGGFLDILDEFIDDFVTFPTAIIKGPIVTTKRKLTWKNGIPVEERVVTYKDTSVHPLDAYPSPGANNLYDGDFIEHVRLTASELSDLTHLNQETGYIRDNIISVLVDQNPGETFWLDSSTEEDKARLELRGSETHGNLGNYHGLHFWGSLSVKLLRDWGCEDEELVGLKEWMYVDVEVLMVKTTVIKLRINKDPLRRRPYYASSFHKRSGSFYGRSLPGLMQDCQGMGNAAVRALALNMGMASGPQMSLLVDRLADEGDIEEQEPFKIWQFESDMQGNAGKPIEYFIAPSNAQDLLRVYETFEAKADDVTGIPKHAYSNEKSAGAAQTAHGLSMLLESASKGIKSAIMNIAKDVIVKRVEFHVYLHLLRRTEQDDPFKFSGDLNVVVNAVDNITLKAAQQQVRKELLQVTANPVDQKIMGLEGRGMLMREIFKDVNISEDVIPDRMELRELQELEAFNEQKALEAQAKSGDKATENARIQIEGQERMHALTVELQARNQDLQRELAQLKAAVEQAKIDQRDMESARREAAREADSKRKASTTVGVEIAKMKKENTVSSDE